MNAIGSIIAAQLWKIALAQWEKHKPEIMAKVEEFKGQVLEFVKDQFAKWMPDLIEATVAAQIVAAEKLAAGAIDRLTDATPGTLDDQLLDQLPHAVLNNPLVKSVLDKITGGRL